MSVVVVGAEKGGVGKTCFAVNIAALAITQGIDGLLVDTDPTGSASEWRRVRTELEHNPPVTIMASAKEPAADIARMSEKFELVTVDVGANSRLSLEQSALFADLLLIPTGADQFELASTQKVFEDLRRIDHRHPSGRIPAYAVLNRMPTNANSQDERLLRETFAELEIPVLTNSCKGRSCWRLIGRTGLALHEMTGRDRDRKAIAEMALVYDEIISLLEKADERAYA